MIRLRGRTMARYCWMLKQIWYYLVIFYLAFTCFYVINVAFPSDTDTPRTKAFHHRKPRTKHHPTPRPATVLPVELQEREDDDFLAIFPDPNLHPNPQQIRLKKRREHLLLEADLEHNQRKQLERELKRQQYEQDLKIWNRVKLDEDIVKYNFTKPRTKKRVDIITKIRWRFLKEHSVSIKDFEDQRVPKNMREYFHTILKKMNTDQSFEYNYKSFSFRRPSFVSDTDRKIFLKHTENENLIQGGRSEDEFRGYVDIYKNGIISEKLECGTKSVRRRFMEYTTDSHVNVQKIDHVVCPLLIPESSTFQHFIDGVLPKIIQAYDIIVPFDVKFLIQAPRDENILFLYDRLGIERSRLIYHKSGIWQAKAVVDICNTPTMHPSLYKTARKAFGSLDNLTVPLSQAHVVLITRENVANYGRRILNKAEIVGTLYNRYGPNFQVLSKTLNVIETVALFKNTKIIIGVHGGGIYNQIFAPSGTTIIEIMPTEKTGEVCKRSGQLSHQIFWNLAAMLGQKYWRLIEEPKMNCDVKVDPKKLEKALNIIDEKHRKEQLLS
ncbi:hypothetical protein SNE40_021030 [Patella caerulea]|uniref:Glycosyltransferase 61 catalytic domain-containing protein n=1 Tax=Patella caerulea TaxID=87958 RepID=A0AAN8J4H4_PATCE